MLKGPQGDVRGHTGQAVETEGRQCRCRWGDVVVGSDAKDVDGRGWPDLHAGEEGFEDDGSGVPGEDMPAGKLDGVGGGAG